jgi:hypothetical protein
MQDWINQNFIVVSSSTSLVTPPNCVAILGPNRRAA